MFHSLEPREKGAGTNLATRKTEFTPSNSKHEKLEAGKQRAGRRERLLLEIILYKDV